jgi:16S rRNA (cytosine967-C5)-methyltransferase
MNPRKVALDVLTDLEGGPPLNVALPARLADSDLSQRDRAFTTNLVYGTARMQRALDFLIDRFTMRELDRPTRAALRLGAYQLHYLHTPPHAAVDGTVAVAPRRSRGLVNAVLRRIAGAPVEWPDLATELSYPDWIVERLVADLGEEDAVAALRRMDEAPEVTVRADGYTQDLASQWVAAEVGARPGELVVDLCAAPGGKATAMAHTGAAVVANEAEPVRARLVAGNAERTGTRVPVVVGDGRTPPLRPGSADRVLVDAPCSGLGVLRRRPDARWRRQPADIDRLAVLQRELLDAAAALVKPGGALVYSVCTLTAAETIDVDRWLADVHPELEPLDAPGQPWRRHGRGALLLPQAAGTDGMALLKLQRAL